MDFQRLILFIALAFVLLLLWQRWIEFNYAPEQTEIAGQIPGKQPSSKSEQQIDQVPTEELPSAPVVEESSKEVADVEANTETSAVSNADLIRVSTDLLDVEINLQGGDLNLVALKKHTVSVDQPDEPFRLMKADGEDLFISQSGLIGKSSDLPNHRTRYRSLKTEYVLADNQQELVVDLDWTSPSGVEYVKSYTFSRDRYLIEINYRVKNNSPDNWTGFLYAQFQRRIPEDEQGYSLMRAVPSYMGGAIYTPQNNYEKITPDDLAETPLKLDTDSGWVAILQHYFVAVWILEDEGDYQIHGKSLSQQRFQIGYTDKRVKTLKPGENGTLSTRIFVGPKEQARLVEYAETLPLTVDYGWLTPVSAPLFTVLQFLHRYIGNWGWSIIAVTMLIKLIFFPLSAASYKSMAKMKKLQPRLQTLKERYGGDRQKLNQAMMEMYKKEKINPLGGCLPILIQIPVFIALYWVLLESVEWRQAPFALWIRDLSEPDPFYILPILFGASMLAQQFLNPAPLDPVQKNIMMAMPIVFTFLFLWFPSGLVLYWVVNNVLSIAQQWYITHKLNQAPAS